MQSFVTIVVLILAFSGTVFSQVEKAEPAKNDAEKILMSYMEAVQEEIGANPRKLGMEGVLTKFHELGEKHLLANKGILHEKAIADYMKMDELVSIDISKHKRIEWIDKSKYVYDGAVHLPDTDPDDIGHIIVMFCAEGYGIPPFDKTVFSTRWWNPTVAASIIRELTFRNGLSEDEAEKRKFLEQHSPPKLFRLSNDPENPSIGFYDGKELFVVDLNYADIGIYCLKGIRWVEIINPDR